MNDFNFNDCLYADIKFNYNNYLEGFDLPMFLKKSAYQPLFFYIM